MSDNKDKIIRQVMTGSFLRKVQADSRTVEFVASDGSVDSYNTVLPVSKWDLTRFKKNGVVSYMHMVYGDAFNHASEPDDVIGKGEAFVEGGQLIVRITFEPADLNPRADKILRKIQFGSLNAVSVGFAPTKPGHRGKKDKGEDPDVFYYDGQELLEVSVVNIPANPNATKRKAGKGGKPGASGRAAHELAAARARAFQAITNTK